MLLATVAKAGNRCPHPAPNSKIASFATRITLKNGDIFNGTTDLKAFDFSTVFGKVSVPLAKLSGMSFGESEIMPPAGSASISAPSIKPPADEKEISALIAELQSKDESRREKAARRLVQIGSPALPALKILLNETNADVRWWVEAVIQEIENKKENIP